MILTQAIADQIVKDIKIELNEVFDGDIVNIDLEKAQEIAKYCRNKINLYHIDTTPVQLGYWTHLSNKYQKAADWTVEALKISDTNPTITPPYYPTKYTIRSNKHKN
jgi:hypothetical protein